MYCLPQPIARNVLSEEEVKQWLVAHSRSVDAPYQSICCSSDRDILRCASEDQLMCSDDSCTKVEASLTSSTRSAPSESKRNPIAHFEEKMHDLKRHADVVDAE